MNEPEIWDRLTGTFRDVFDDEEIELEAGTTADDIPEWDSLTHIELLVAVEQTFRVRFNTGEVANLPNVGAMVKLIGAKLGG